VSTGKGSVESVVSWGGARFHGVSRAQTELCSGAPGQFAQHLVREGRGGRAPATHSARSKAKREARVEVRGRLRLGPSARALFPLCLGGARAIERARLIRASASTGHIHRSTGRGRQRREGWALLCSRAKTRSSRVLTSMRVCVCAWLCVLLLLIKRA
jgi:hypothetical protein